MTFIRTVCRAPGVAGLVGAVCVLPVPQALSEQTTAAVSTAARTLRAMGASDPLLPE
jgi:hypothetical protein